MKGKKCQIVCEGTVIGTIEHTGNGINIQHTKEGKELCKKMHGECCH